MKVWTMHQTYIRQTSRGQRYDGKQLSNADKSALVKLSAKLSQWKSWIWKASTKFWYRNMHFLIPWIHWKRKYLSLCTLITILLFCIFKVLFASFWHWLTLLQPPFIQFWAFPIWLCAKSEFLLNPKFAKNWTKITERHCGNLIYQSFFSKGWLEPLLS